MNHPDGAASRHIAEMTELFEEMRSLSFEARCLWDEQRRSADSTRRQALASAYDEVQQRFRAVMMQHAAKCRRIRI